jgi:hypothetical protein
MSHSLKASKITLELVKDTGIFLYRELYRATLRCSRV